MSEKNKEVKIKDSLSDLFDNSTNFIKDADSNKMISDSSPKKLNKVMITRFAYTKMIIMAQEVSKLLNQSMEVYALCIGDNGIIEDLLIPPQMVSSISIRINASDILSLAPYIRENNLNIIGWVHSHGDMSSFFSITDDINQITVLNDTSNYSEVGNIRVKYCFGITVNMREEFFGIVTTQFPSGNITHENAIFVFTCDLPTNWNENEIRKEISEELKKNIKKKEKINSFEFRDNSNSNNDYPNLKEKESDTALLSSRDRYLIDKYLKSNNISNPKIKKLLINFVRYINLNKKWKKKEPRKPRNQRN